MGIFCFNFKFMTNSTSVRVRFAPSPTGHLHVGGLRTALYNYLFARKQKGTFVLRIEDTDRSRFVPGAVESVIETLNWAGLEFDEGPGKLGHYGPYVQSERLQIYQAHAKQLLQHGTAYRCFCTLERLEEMRRQQEAKKIPPKYDRHCLALSRSAVEENTAKKIPFVVRMKIPDASTVKFHDVVRNDLEFVTDRLDDQVLMKSDGYPTYHLANVVDDHLMEISHVIRGEEWLSSTPKHVLLYEYFAWAPPVFAHLPLLLNPDRSKLSKRQGDVAVEEYRAKGYLNDVLVNFVALLGWNPGTEQEVFSLPELVEQFSLERVNKAGAIFNLEKLNWLNFEHLRKKSNAEVLQMLKAHLLNSKYRSVKFDDAYLLRVIEAMRQRVTFVQDFTKQASFFFEAPTGYEHDVIRKRWKAESPGHLNRLSEEFLKLQNPGKEAFELALQKTAKALGIGNGDLIHPVRLAVSGIGGGPGVYDILTILGRDETVKRIQSAIERIKPV